MKVILILVGSKGEILMEDELAKHAQKEKTLTTGQKVKHIGVFLPLTIDRARGVFVAQQDNKEHRIEDFDWEGSRYCI